MGYYITPLGVYYQGDRIHALDIEVPQRPDASYAWNGAAWISVPSVAPDALGFWNDLVTLAGGVLQLNSFLSKNYPTLKGDALRSDWADVSAFIQDAKAKGTISAAQYVSIQGFATNRHLPLVLP